MCSNHDFEHIYLIITTIKAFLPPHFSSNTTTIITPSKHFLAFYLSPFFNPTSPMNMKNNPHTSIHLMILHSVNVTLLHACFMKLFPTFNDPTTLKLFPAKIGVSPIATEFPPTILSLFINITVKNLKLVEHIGI